MNIQRILAFKKHVFPHNFLGDLHTKFLRKHVKKCVFHMIYRVFRTNNHMVTPEKIVFFFYIQCFFV